MRNYYPYPKKRNIIKHIIQLENLEEDLIKFGIKRDNVVIPHKNKSSNNSNFDQNDKAGYLKYYDREMIDLVKKKDKYIFEAFDYDLNI